MLNSVTFKKNYRCFKKGDIFHFKPFTVLVGDQGCGKSSLLKLISDTNKNVLEFELSNPSVETPTAYIDFERNPLRNTGYFSNNGKVFQAQVGAMFISHGETVKTILDRLKEHKKGTCILMDEPDMALSPRSIVRLYENMNSIKDKFQIICSIHNPWFIEMMENVLSLEHKCWVSSKDFLKEHLNQEEENFDVITFLKGL